jgi:hypothetical protein
MFFALIMNEPDGITFAFMCCQNGHRPLHRTRANSVYCDHLPWEDMQLKSYHFPSWLISPRSSRSSSLWPFTITLEQTILGRNPLDGWSARSRGLYLTTHNTQTSMTPAGVEPAISASERPQTLDRAATGIGEIMSRNLQIMSRDLQIVSRDLQIMSRNLQIMSRNLQTMSRNLQIMSRNLQIMSRNLQIVSRNLRKFRVSLRVLGINPLPPNDIYTYMCVCRTAPLTLRRCILNIYSTNIRAEYFKHVA